MTLTERLVLELEVSGARSAISQVMEFANAGKVATAAVIGLAVGLGNATTKYQNYEAALKTATGTSEKARVALEALQKYAKDTPYDLDQTTTAFLRMVNLGLTPSEEALKSYGNTASSFPQKSLMDFVEAVADATSLQFRRLREFGIVAQRDGETVKFTFQNISTTVKASAQDIEKYLLSIGNNNFAGAMADRMNTLGGATAQVGDEWDKLWINMARLGADRTITEAVRSIGEALGELNAQLASGEMSTNIANQALAWKDFGDMAKEGFASALKYSLEYSWIYQQTWKGASEETTEIFKYAWDYLPIVTASAIRTIIAETAGLVLKIQAFCETIKEAFIAAFDIVGRRAALVQQQAGLVAKSLLGMKGFEQAAEESKKAAADLATFDAEAIQQLAENHAKRMGLVDQVTKEEVDAIRERSSATVAEYVKGQEDAARKRAEWELRQKELEKGVLGQFAKPGAGEDSDEAEKEDKKAASKRAREEKAALSRLQSLERELMTEEELINDKYAERAAIILSATSITENEKTSLMIKAAKDREEAITALERKQQELRVQAATTFFGNIASIGSAFGEKGFKIAKAAGIAQATISMYSAAVKAYDSLSAIPYVGPYLGAAAAAAAIAAGAANIANIKSTSYSGAYADGGMIPSGKFGLVGEAGPEFVQGPAMVRSAADSRRAFAEGGRDVNVTVHVHNLPGQTASVQQESGPNGETQLRVIIERVEEKLTADAMSGGGKLVPTLQQQFGLQRGGGRR